ncbi:hypothetical protein LYSHEL_06100 [Lysobacter helvus]|uniref:DUF1295 domain-containing protein n=2 Tax=Lysobacteraceae TaxID=32033 RepID=A0ABM7Q2V3_9GAMM|nr:MULTISPECIES: DUF6498-containing protein [Lysobacter]BCT91586.1 hypothetical protein LYSCAS_06100 [Lysobacter caseinilyticus]BCT94739.1 hypothetical protein LYSHEL_06100 [Lysobacter helvus]
MTPSARNLLLSNAATLAAALVFHWPAGWLLWTYWIQSVVIGWYARKRMLNLRRFSTTGFTSNDQPVPENEQGKRSTANFFALHYGFFHLCYFLFLCAEHRVTAGWDLLVLAACGVSFVLSQQQTYAAQHAADLRGKPNLGTLMFTPYLRIIPMHLAILVGAGLDGGAGLLVLFTVLKTASDLGLDAIDRNMALKHAEKFASEGQPEH